MLEFDGSIANQLTPSYRINGVRACSNPEALGALKGQLTALQFQIAHNNATFSWVNVIELWPMGPIDKNSCAQLNVLPTDSITSMEIHYTESQGLNYIKMTTFQNKSLEKGRLEQTNEQKKKWNFSEEMQLIGLWGMEDTVKVQKIGIILYNTTCGLQTLEPQVVPLVVQSDHTKAIVGGVIGLLLFFTLVVLIFLVILSVFCGINACACVSGVACCGRRWFVRRKKELILPVDDLADKRDSDEEERPTAGKGDETGVMDATTANLKLGDFGEDIAPTKPDLETIAPKSALEESDQHVDFVSLASHEDRLHELK